MEWIACVQYNAIVALWIELVWDCKATVLYCIFLIRWVPFMLLSLQSCLLSFHFLVVISTNTFIMCCLSMQTPPPVAAFHPLPWLPPQGLLAAACLPAASHPLWANNGRRGPSLEAYSLGLYRGCCGWCFGEEGCACPWKAESMGVGSWGGGGGWQEKAGRAQIKIQCLSAYVSTLALVHGVCAGSGDSWDFQGALLARQLTWWEREEARATN